MMTLANNQILQDRYRTSFPLGQGGIGAVYHAQDTHLNVAFALKEMAPQPGLDPHPPAQPRQQFQQEATILAHLDHPHLVRVTDFFQKAGNRYLMINFVEGERLTARIWRSGALAEEKVLAWEDCPIGGGEEGDKTIGHQSEVRGLDSSPDGKLLTSADFDRASGGETVALWGVAPWQVTIEHKLQRQTIPRNGLHI